MGARRDDRCFCMNRPSGFRGEAPKTRRRERGNKDDIANPHPLNEISADTGRSIKEVQPRAMTLHAPLKSISCSTTTNKVQMVLRMRLTIFVGEQEDK